MDDYLPVAVPGREAGGRCFAGLDEEVMAIRHSNKERIIAGLIRKIERRHAPTSRFQFTEGMSYAEKYVKVQEWWNTGRFHLAMAFKSPTELISLAVPCRLERWTCWHVLVRKACRFL